MSSCARYLRVGATTVLKKGVRVVGGRKDSQRLRPQDPVEITCVTDERCDVTVTARSALTALVAQGLPFGKVQGRVTGFGFATHLHDAGDVPRRWPAR